MKKTKIGVLLLSLILAMAVAFAFVACDNTGDDPTHTQHVDADGDGKCDECGEDMNTPGTDPTGTAVTDGIFEFSEPFNSGASSGTLTSIIHFYENGIFYADFQRAYIGGQEGTAQYTGIGEWELVNTGTEYTVNGETKTSEKSITITKYDWPSTNPAEYESQTLAYANDTLYGVYVRSTSAGDPVIIDLAHDPDSDHDAADEQQFQVARYEMAENGSSNYVSLGHNGGFVVSLPGKDASNMEDDIQAEEGTWVMNDDGSYTLTGKDVIGDDFTATLTPSADGSTAVFKMGDYTENLILPVEVTEVVTFSGSTQMDIGGDEPATIEITLVGYSDGSAVLSNSMQPTPMAEGTYELKDGVYTFEMGATYGTLESTFDSQTGATTVSISMGTDPIVLTKARVAAITLAGTQAGQLPNAGEPTSPYPVDIAVNLVLYDDFSATVTFALPAAYGGMGGTLEIGTWMANSYGIPASVTLAGDKTIEIVNVNNEFKKLTCTYTTDKIELSVSGQTITIASNVSCELSYDLPSMG